MSEAHQFVHQFSNGVIGTLVFDPEKHYHPESKAISPAKSWNREVADEEFEEMFPEYLEWAHTVHAQISELVGECLYLVQDSYALPPFRELWIYRPGGGKERIAREIWDAFSEDWIVQG